MNKRERFAELVATIDLMEPLKTLDKDNYDACLRFPDLTSGLDDRMGRALITHAVQQGDEWCAKVYATLMNSAMSHTVEQELTQEDINAFAIAANIAWANKEGVHAMRALGALSMAIVAREHLECPELAYMIFRNPSVAQALKDENPYEFLGDDNAR